MRPLLLAIVLALSVALVLAIGEDVSNGDKNLPELDEEDEEEVPEGTPTKRLSRKERSTLQEPEEELSSRVRRSIDEPECEKTKDSPEPEKIKKRRSRRASDSRYSPIINAFQGAILEKSLNKRSPGLPALRAMSLGPPRPGGKAPF